MTHRFCSLIERHLRVAIFRKGASSASRCEKSQANRLLETTQFSVMETDRLHAEQNDFMQQTVTFVN